MDIFCTYGTEYLTTNNFEPYQGFYCKYQNKVYTGYSYNSEYSIELISISSYNPEKTVNIPKHLPSPTTEDYFQGSFIRYFAKHKLHNPAEIFEISQSTYNMVNNSTIMPYILYQTIQIQWLLDNFESRMDIAMTNVLSINYANKSFSGLNDYIINFKEFTKE